MQSGDQPRMLSGYKESKSALREIVTARDDFNQSQRKEWFILGSLAAWRLCVENHRIKTPREILLQRHEGANEKLDAVREDALATAFPRPPRVTHHSFLSTLNQQLSTVFLPSPKAWAGLAAVWALILTVNFALRDKTPMDSVKFASSPETILVLRQQQRLLAELIGPPPALEVTPPRRSSPRPRSEARHEILTA